MVKYGRRKQDEVDRQEKILKEQVLHKKSPLNISLPFLVFSDEWLHYTSFSRQPLGASKKCSYTSFGHPGILKVARPHDVSEWNS